jgi:hypothetical protein
MPAERLRSISQRISLEASAGLSLSAIMGTMT